MSHEIELKLEIPPEHAKRLRSQTWFGEAEFKTEHQKSTYYDTPAGVLRDRGYSLRVRLAGNRLIQTLKSMDGGAGLFVRGEWEYDIDRPEPELERLAHTPAADVDLGTLETVVCSEVNRTTCRLQDLGSEIEVDLDEGLIIAGEQQLPVSELELELIDGRAEAVFSLARRIADESPVKLAVLSKAERGFALADGKLSKASKAEPVHVDTGMTVAEGLATIVNACIRHFRLNEALVIEERKVEALHQARVAMRRLRSAFSLFGPAIDDEESERIREELRWFTGELGEARNLDVYLQRELPAADRRRLRKRREAAYDWVAETMNSDRFRRLMLDLAGWAALGLWRDSPTATQPLQPFTNRRMDRLWHRISAAKRLGHMPDHDRHRLRIQIKKLRYATEFVHELHAGAGDRQKEFGKALEELQEELGRLNDIAVAQSLTSSGPWLMVPPDPEAQGERHHVRAAQHALRRLRKTGAYWSV